MTNFELFHSPSGGGFTHFGEEHKLSRVKLLCGRYGKIPEDFENVPGAGGYSYYGKNDGWGMCPRCLENKWKLDYPGEPLPEATTTVETLRGG